MSIKWKPLRTSALAVAVAGAVAAPNMAQADPSIEELRRMIEVQQQQINQMRSALEETRRGVKSAEMKADEAAMQAAVSKPKFLDRLTIGGLAEVEMTETETFAQASSSDITLATVELFVDAQLHEYLNTHIQFKYEDDGNDNITLDEGNFTVGNTDEFPVYMTAGRWYLPFGGDFATDMSSDPLTLNLGEFNDTAILVGATKYGATIEGYVLNGDTQQDGEGNQIDQFGITAGYGGELEGVGFNIGGGYTNNIAEANEVTDGVTNSTRLVDYVGAVEVHGDVTFKGVTLRGAYMTAVDTFDATNLAFNGQGAKPSVWVTEASYATEILGKETIFAGTVQGTEESQALGFPELRIGGAVTVGLVDNFAVTAEYLHDEDYDTGDGGTGNNGSTATLKLAAEF